MKGKNMDQRDCACLETRDGQEVSLMGVRLSGDLRGLMFEASIEQRFCNPGDKNVEVVYSFPLPWGAVLLGVDVVLGDKHLTGAVVEKKKAEARYEEAISEGDAAIMLEKNRDHSYSLNLGNLAPREHCTITLTTKKLGKDCATATETITFTGDFTVNPVKWTAAHSAGITGNAASLSGDWK